MRNRRGPATVTGSRSRGRIAPATGSATALPGRRGDTIPEARRPVPGQPRQPSRKGWLKCQESSRSRLAARRAAAGSHSVRSAFAAAHRPTTSSPSLRVVVSRRQGARPNRRVTYTRHRVDQDRPEGGTASARAPAAAATGSTIGPDRARARPQTRSTGTTALDPLLVTDAFDFGLGICGFGGKQRQRATASGT